MKHGALRPSVRLVPWVRAWRAGLVPYDDVVPAVTGDDEHTCRGVPDADAHADAPLAAAITALAGRTPDEIRLVLPVPGDPRGLPGPGAFTSAALLREEGVIAGDLGLVPEVTRHRSGSGDTWHTVGWQAYRLPAEPVPMGAATSPADAELELATALHETTDALGELDVARWRPELAATLAELRRAGTVPELPAGYDARSRRLHARAATLARVLALAAEDPVGGAVNAYEARQRAEALRPLASACRHALVAATNAPLSL